MFGKHWTPARGTIVARRGRTSSDGDVTTYDFVVDVTTASGEVFRSKVEEPRIATNFRDPSIGEVVGVEYDDESRKVRFDKDDPSLSWKNYKRSRNDAFDATLAAQPGTPATVAPLNGMPGAPNIPNMPDLSQLQAMLQAQGVGAGPFAGAQVIQMTPGSPEADALRAALLQAFGGAAAAPATDTPPPDAEAPHPPV